MNIYDIFKQLNIEFKEKEHEPIFTIEQAQNIKNKGNPPFLTALLRIIYLFILFWGCNKCIF